MTKKSNEHNDYDQLSHRLKIATTGRKPISGNSYSTKPERSNNTAQLKNNNKTSFVISGEKAVQNVTEYMGIRVGDYINYTNKAYTVNCTVLEIHEQTKRLVVKYKNGVMDNISLNPDKIRVISRAKGYNAEKKQL